MIVQFTPPEQSDSFYSKPMHDEFCKLCDKKGIPENKRTEYAEKMGFGFGYVYMCEMQKAIHSWNGYYFLEEADGHIYRYDDALNNAAANVESTVGGAMTHYLVDRGGTVDCWPSPFWPDAFSLKLVSKHHERYYNEEDEEWVVKDEKTVSGSFSVPFMYFGSKYVQHVRTEVSTAGSNKYTDSTQKTETWRIDQKPSLVYRYHSSVPDKPEEYKSLSRKKYELENQYKEALEKRRSQKGHKATRFLIGLPTIITIIFALLMLFWQFTGTETLQDAVNKGVILSWLTQAVQSDGFMKVIAFIPAIVIKIAAIFWYLSSLFGSFIHMEKFVVIACAGLLVVGGLMLSITIDDHVHPSCSAKLTKKEWKEARIGKKEAQRIGAMPKYKAFEKEHFRLMDEWDEFAKAWHNAWFEALNNAQKN